MPNKPLFYKVMFCCSESPPPLPSAVPAAQPPAAVASAAAAAAPPASTTLLSALRPSQAASDIESSLSSLAAQLGGAVSASENLQTDFLSAFVQLLQTQAVCLFVTAVFNRPTLQCTIRICIFMPVNTK